MRERERGNKREECMREGGRKKERGGAGGSQRGRERKREGESEAIRLREREATRE